MPLKVIAYELLKKLVGTNVAVTASGFYRDKDALPAVGKLIVSKLRPKEGDVLVISADNLLHADRFAHEISEAFPSQTVVLLPKGTELSSMPREDVVRLLRGLGEKSTLKL